MTSLPLIVCFVIFMVWISVGTATAEVVNRARQREAHNFFNRVFKIGLLFHNWMMEFHSVHKTYRIHFALLAQRTMESTLLVVPLSLQQCTGQQHLLRFRSFVRKCPTESTGHTIFYMLPFAAPIVFQMRLVTGFRVTVLSGSSQPNSHILQTCLEMFALQAWTGVLDVALDSDSTAISSLAYEKPRAVEMETRRNTLTMRSKKIAEALSVR